MAYRRYNRRRNYRRRRRPQSNSWFNTSKFTPQKAYALASQAAKDIWYIKGLVNSEMLHATFTGSGTLGNASSPTVLNLTALAQGDTVAGRTGNSILLRGLQMRFQFTNNASAINTLYRVILVQDNQTVSDETTLAVTDILDTASTLAPISVANAGRFKILKNWYFGTNTVAATQKVIQQYLKMYHHVRYNGAASTDIQKGAIFLIAFCDQSVNQPVFSYNIKTNYHDN